MNKEEIQKRLDDIQDELQILHDIFEQDVKILSKEAFELNIMLKNMKGGEKKDGA